MDNPIRRSANPITEGDLAIFEHKTEITLPAEYRAFLLANNGGVSQRNRFFHKNKEGKKRETWVRHFFPLGREGLIDPDWYDLEMAFAERPEGLPKGIILVARADFSGNDGFVCIGTEGKETGKVFFRPEVDPKKTTLYAVADSWNEFLQSMQFEEGKKAKEWKTAIETGDVEALKSWLEKNKRKCDAGDVRIDLIRAVVEENNWEMIEVLLQHDFEVPWMFQDMMNCNRYDLARQLLHRDLIPESEIKECLVKAEPFLWYLPPFLEELIAAGADVNYEDDSGETPLHKAVTARSEEGVRLLLAKGADPTIKNDDDRTPRKLAQRLEETKLMEILKQAEEAWAKRPKPVEPAVIDFDLKGVVFQKTGPQITLEEIKAFEEEIKLEFTPEYRGLLLKVNGGKPKPNTIAIKIYDEDDEDEDDEDYEDDDADSDEENESEPRISFEISTSRK